MGRIVGPFGLQGWLKVKPFTEEPAGLGDFSRWLIGAREGRRALALEDFEVHSKGPVAKLAGGGREEVVRGKVLPPAKDAVRREPEIAISQRDRI